MEQHYSIRQKISSIEEYQIMFEETKKKLKELRNKDYSELDFKSEWHFNQVLQETKQLLYSIASSIIHTISSLKIIDQYEVPKKLEDLRESMQDFYDAR